MARKVFISFLGTGQIKRDNITFNFTQGQYCT